MYKRICFGFVLILLGCSSQENQSNGQPVLDPGRIVKKVKSVDEFNKILESAGDNLLAFDMYADWCMPCKILSPILEKVALEKRSKVTVYKVDTDRFPGIAQAFGVTGIPHVAFVKEKEVVYALSGLQPREAFLNAIDSLSVE